MNIIIVIIIIIFQSIIKIIISINMSKILFRLNYVWTTMLV